MNIRSLTAAAAAFLLLALSCMAAAAESDNPDDVAIVPIYEPNPARPFTPDGTGTVVDFAAESDGKLFYTIQTPDGNVFYLVIDRQRSTENVYFLNAVTEADLLSLAKIPERPVATASPPPPVATAPPINPTPAPMPDQGGNDLTMYILAAVVVVIGGGVGWYVKVYRPKRQGTGDREYEPPSDDAIAYPGGWDDDGETETSPLWDDGEGV